MRKHFLMLILFVTFGHAGNAQKSDLNYHKVESFIRDYFQFSRLGPGYSREMSQETIDQFKGLFEPGAFLFWDLYRSAADSLRPQLAVNDYVDQARELYHLRQPLLDYPSVKIRVQKYGGGAEVYLTKINLVVDDDDKPLVKHHVKLRFSLGLYNDKPQILNIFEDTRRSVVSSISVGGNYLAWSSVASMLVYHPHVHVAANEQFREINFKPGITVQAGGMVELRTNREKSNGLTFCTGLLYSQTYLSSSMLEYERSFPDTIDKGTANPLSCTTFERSPEVWEKILIRKVEVPLMLKGSINDWIYVKPGISISYINTTSAVNYVFSRTGGGLVTNLATQESYTLEKNNEFDQKENGYFRNDKYSFSREKIVNRITLSLQLALGFEKKVRSFGFELEPNISLGMNPLYNKSLANSYPLNDPEKFVSVLKTTEMPVLEFTFGIRILVSYFFKN